MSSRSKAVWINDRSGLFLLAGIVVLALTGIAGAEETRASLVAERQAAKASRLQAAEPDMIERLVTKASTGLAADVPTGFYPYLHGAYPGGSLALGVGYRRPFGVLSAIDLHAVYSVKKWSRLEASLTLPGLLNDAVRTELFAQYINAPDMNGYGIGNSTSKENQREVLYNPVSVTFDVSVRTTPWLAWGGGVGYLENRSDAALSQLGGLRPDPPWRGDVRTTRYVINRAFAAVDWRPSEGYATHGGVYRIQYSRYDQSGGVTKGFERLDVRADQLVPLLRNNWVIALHTHAAFTGFTRKSVVPFCLLPELGGGDFLRGYADHRFRDRNALLFAAEYRWTPSKFMDLAVFGESGRVAEEAADLMTHGFHTSYGIGARFHSMKQTFLRVDLARSVEGFRFIISSSTPF